MSSRLVGLVLEHYPGAGNELLLAIVVADEADHNGGNVRATIPLMARLSRQTEQNVRRLFRKMEDSTWLQCLERSAGGRGKPSLYCINPDWVRLPTGWQAKPEQPEQNPNLMCGFTGAKPENNVRVSDPSPLSLKTFPPLSPHASGSAVPSATAAGEGERDLALAGEIFALIQRMHPKHREPNWKRWCKGIRAMVNKGKSHDEIRDLFTWANSDPFWKTNILSPDKLWAQWDRLIIRRNVDPKHRATSASAADDGLCAKGCGRAWTRQQGKSGPKLCGECADASERYVA